MPPFVTGDELRRWREQHAFTQDYMGELLGISREWIGKLERGDREISADVFLRFENLRRDPKFSASSLDQEMKPLYDAAAVHEDSVPYGEKLETVRDQIRAIVEKTIAAAGDDRDRLGWVRVQVETHLRVPEPWLKNAELRKAQELVEKMKGVQDATRRSRSSGAG